MSATINPPVPGICQFCFHPAHAPAKCSSCKCNGKSALWRRLLAPIGTAFGQLKFGGGDD